MASDFIVAWQFSQREQWFCFLLGSTSMHMYIHTIIAIGVVLTRRRMHLCMQDDQISQKFIGLTPADIDRPFNKYRKKVFSSKQPSPSAGITP
jgi:hypothetical protein